MKKLNIGIVGYKFMGKAHSNAWMKAPRFFDLDVQPVMKVACGRHEEPLKEFAKRWGWEEVETDWRKMVERDDIDIVDIASPQNTHHEIAIAAAKAGKHIFCEKPQALNYKQAKEMYEVAEKSGIVHYLNHNYRRCPAVMLAKRLIKEGKIGKIFHWLGEYLQSWIVDPNFPLTWHLRKETAGYGPIPDEVESGTFKAAIKSTEKGKVGVEDAAFMLAEFENGALGCFNTTRFAPGRKNYNHFEIYGDKGSIIFNFERMNELQYFSADDPEYAQGFRTIIATETVHDYIEGWWPPGHIIGYEHEFVHAAVDFGDRSRTRIGENWKDCAY